MTAAKDLSDKKALAPVPDHWDHWDGTPLEPSPALRWGFSTGACLAAVLTASYKKRLHDGADDALAGDTADILFGDNVVRTLPLEKELPDFPGFTVIRKNGGDDPDCTHGLLLAGRIVPMQDRASCGCDMRDIELAVGEGTVVLHALSGIGTATRKGLDCSQGHWAVNSGVLNMLAANLKRAGLNNGTWLAEFFIPNGEELAKKTLNRTLGITGGLSILGTTGLVRPFSHEAYLATIRVCLRSAAEAGRCAVLCTGRRTLLSAMSWAQTDACKKSFGPLAENAFLTIADFLGDSLQYASQLGFASILVVCMPGKLLKYAAGYANTHAAKTSQDMPLLAKTIARILPGKSLPMQDILACTSMREACGFLSDEDRDVILHELAQMALDNFAGHCQNAARTLSGGASLPCPGLLVTDFEGKILFLSLRKQDA